MWLLFSTTLQGPRQPKNQHHPYKSTPTRVRVTIDFAVSLISFFMHLCGTKAQHKALHTPRCLKCLFGFTVEIQSPSLVIRFLQYKAQVITVSEKGLGPAWP